MASQSPCMFPEPQTWLPKHSHKCSLVGNKTFPASTYDPSFYKQITGSNIYKKQDIFNN